MPQPPLKERNIFDTTPEDLSDPTHLAALKKAISDKVQKLRSARNLAAIEEPAPKKKKKKSILDTPVGES